MLARRVRPVACSLRLVFTMILAVAAAGCVTAESAQAAPRAAPRGALFVYASPLPQAAARLSLRIEAVYAVSEDGSNTALSLLLRDMSGRSPGRERRLATGRLPAGRYSGLRLKIGSASLSGSAGETSLLVPEEPLLIEVPFAVARDRGTVLRLELDDGGSYEEGATFLPTFTAHRPARPATALLAIASSLGDGEIAAFDKTTGRTAAIIPTGGAAAGIAIDDRRRRAYAALPGEDAVLAIDLAELAVVSRLRLRGGDEPTELALTPDGATLLVANTGSSSVSVIDPLSMIEAARVPAGEDTQSILVGPAGRRAYAFNRTGGTITVIDIATRAVAGSIATDPGPFRGRFDRTGSALYVVYEFSPYLSIIDPLMLAQQRRIFVGAGVTSLEVDRQRGFIYVARRGSDTIDAYDPLSLLPLDAIPARSDVSWMVNDPEQNALLLVLPKLGEIEIYELDARRSAARVDTGAEPYWVATPGDR